jgi:nucleotide-binding universal stress UspA family protein
MFERILAPLDGSPLAESILPLVRAFRARKRTELVLLRALPPPPMVGGDVGRVMELDRRAAEEYLEGLRKAESAGEGSLRVRVREGPPAETILAVAREERATLIALSTHGRTGLRRLLFGSVAEQVLRESPIPVLLLRGQAAAPEPRKILLPVDPDDVSLEVVNAAIEVASTFGAHVVLLNVMKDALAYGPPVVQITRAFERFREAGVSVEPLLRRGDPADEILAAARDLSAGMIAIATHARRGLRRALVGSVAEKVLRHAEVPVLAIRGGEGRRPLALGISRREEGGGMR